MTGKNVTMSSTYDASATISFAGSKAVDGVYDVWPDGQIESYSIAITANEDLTPWWRVNLEMSYCIWGLNILNRSKGGECFLLECQKGVSVFC